MSSIGIDHRGRSSRAAAGWLGFGILLLALSAVAAAGQVPDEFRSTPLPTGEGWAGFTEISFLLDAFLKLSLAMVLGAVIGYHPRRLRTADTVEEIEAPKVSIVYAVIGSLIGILVVKYGLVVGFVLFGIGGLIRFRTVMGSAQLTGQVIFVTLIGLTCGLDLPHMAVLATLFDVLLTFVLEARITYKVEVRGLDARNFRAATDAYRSILTGHGFRVLSEKKLPDKGRVRFIFRSGRLHTQEKVEEILEDRVEPSLRGALNWEVD
jgi:hypothetical protein